MPDLKTTRTSAKRAVTKQVNLIRQCIATDNTKDLHGEVDKLKSLFQVFDKACNDLAVTLKEDKELDECDEYFADVQNNFIKALEQAKRVLHVCEPVAPSPSAQTSIESDLVKLLSAVNMPKVEIQEFSGDPCQFHQFMKCFEINVDAHCTDDNLKLTCLLQYTAGPAYDAIKGCVLIGGADGYKQAMDILEDRFGNAYLVSDRIVRDLKFGKPVKSPLELQQLSDDVKNAKLVLLKLKMLGEVSSQSMIVDIVNRLPPYLQNSWRKHALDSKRSKGVYPTFDDLSKYLSNAASDMSDPVYGQAFRRRDKDNAKLKHEHVSHGATADNVTSKRPTEGNNATGSTHNAGSYARVEPPCVLCTQRHRLWHCRDFKQLSPRDRLALVNRHKLCHNCLLGSHDTQSCGKNSVCSVPGCGQKHTMYLHINENSSLPVTNTTSGCTSSTISYMPIVKVMINENESAYCLLDTGSSNTFCTQELARKLGITGEYHEMNLKTLSEPTCKKSEVVNLSVSSVDGVNIKMSGVFVIDEIPVKNAPINVDQYDHLRDLNFTATQDVKRVDLLIGQDYSDVLIPLEVRRGQKGEPFAIRSMLGWCLNGSIPTNIVGQKVISHFVVANNVNDNVNVQDIKCNIDRLWEIDNEGMTTTSLSQNDKYVLDLWDRNNRKVNGHYELEIPWHNSDDLPNNVNVAKSRLTSLVKRLERDGLEERYNEEIEKLITKGYAEKVPDDEIDSNPNRTWYLPHHHVISPKKPNKVRIVYDCASAYHGKSLNDRVLQGPDLVNKLLHVLLRFRQHSYALQADIEAMYNQVLIPVKDRDALRFLWITDGKITHYRKTCHLFGGIWCASSSTYALRRTVIDNPDVHPLVRDTVYNSFYVDDCIRSLVEKADVLTVINGTTEVLKQGGFNLTQFVVNDPEILEQIPEEKRAVGVRDITPSMEGKVLGIKWNISLDSFFFDVRDIPEHLVTRRKMCSILPSIYDPLGFIGPMILPGKVLLQDATRLKLSWDETVPTEIEYNWFKWLNGLRSLIDLQIPRCVKPRDFDCDTCIEIHHFADASLQAYGACSYIRCINKDGRIHSQLLISKCRVAPIKQRTIPRLELQAALLAAELDKVLRAELDLEIVRSYFWSDSEVVLSYIRNDTSRFHVFVENRVSAIRQLSNPDDWHYVNTKDNPADLLTRSKHLLAHNLDKKWFNGPTWLSNYKSNWPVYHANLALAVDDPEVKVSIVSLAGDVTDPLVDPVYRVSVHFSSWMKMQRSLAWLFRFAEYLSNFIEGSLQLSEINRAKIALVKQSQRQYYGKEMHQLTTGTFVNKSSVLSSFCPYIDSDGVMRVGGRTGEHPYIIPNEHPIATAIILYFHNEAHVGAEWTLSLVRQEFWIVRARVLVKKLLDKCVTCKKLYGKPGSQQMASLPPERIETDTPPFTNVGVDCFGPITIRNYRSDIKRYGCVFTCMVTRAIHIEKLNSLDTDSFINGFRRFIARRGNVSTVLSDNGKNFVGGENEMRRAAKDLDMIKVQRYAEQCNIAWKFNPPLSPHMGGSWERMVGSIKRVMKAVLLNEPRLSDEILETVFCEIENIVNGRPLTKLSDDPSDLTPLTPNHLIMLKGGPVLPPGKFTEHDRYRRRWRHAQHLADRFWCRWKRLYLPELQKRVKWLDKQRNLAVGDLVLIADENTPRNVWPLARVTEINPGRDGLVRSVKLRTRATELVRPVTKIILLEAANVS